MTKNTRNTKAWMILALLNVLVILYPTSLYLNAGDGESRLMGAFALIGVAFILAIADMFTIVIAIAD